MRLVGLVYAQVFALDLLFKIYKRACMMQALHLNLLTTQFSTRETQI